jgi:hypothetical protein
MHQDKRPTLSRFLKMDTLAADFYIVFQNMLLLLEWDAEGMPASI